MKTSLAAALSLLFATLACAAELQRDDFAYAMRLEVDGGAPLYELPLPDEVYQYVVSPTLADLRVMNGRGEVVPFAVLRHVLTQPVASGFTDVPLFPLRGDPAQAAPLLSLRVDSSGGKVELESAPQGGSGQRLAGYLLDARAIRQPLTALELQWRDDVADFSDQVVIEAGDDLTQWRRIASAPLVYLHFNGTQLRQQRVELPAVQARYIRLLWPEGGTTVELRGAAVVTAATPVPVQRHVKRLPARPAADMQRTYLFDLGAQPPVDRIELLLPELNTVAHVSLASRARAADEWQPVISATEFRLANKDGPELVSNPGIVAENRHRYWKATVSAAGGGLGPALPQLQVQWAPEMLRFVARGAGPYELVFGSAAEGEMAAVPVAFDGNLATADGHRVEAVAVGVGALTTAGGPQRLLPPVPLKPWKTWLLWGVLGCGTLLLGYFAWRLIRELGQDNELTP